MLSKKCTKCLTYKGIYNLVTNKAKTYKGWKIKNLKDFKN